MLITDEAREVSIDALADIAEVGIIVKLKTILMPTKAVDGNSLKSEYSEFYSQTEDSLPVSDKEYDLTAILSYSPSTEKLKSSGLDEQCSVVVMITTYELIKNGFVKETDNLHDMVTNLKIGKFIDISGQLFSVKSVGMVGTLNGFSIICNLGCDVYV